MITKTINRLCADFGYTILPPHEHHPEFYILIDKSGEKLPRKLDRMAVDTLSDEEFVMYVLVGADEYGLKMLSV